MIDDGAKARRDTLLGFALGGLIAAVFAALTLPAALAGRDPLSLPGGYVDATARVAGLGIGMALIAWVIFYYAFLKRRLPERAAFAFFAMFAVIAAVAGAAVAVRHLSMVALLPPTAEAPPPPPPAVDTAAALRDALADCANAMALIAGHRGGRVMVHAAAPGVAGAFGRATMAMVNDIGAAVAAERTASLAIGFPAFLDGKALRRPGGYAKARDDLERMRQTKRALSDRIVAVLARYRAWVAGAALDDPIKASALTLIDQWAAKEGAWRAALLKDNDALVGDGEALVRGLQHARGTWAPNGSKLSFSDKRDADAFGARVHALEADIRRLGSLNGAP